MAIQTIEAADTLNAGRVKINSNFAELASLLQQAGVDIDSIEVTLTAQGISINSINGSITSLNGSVSSLNSSVSSLNSTVATLGLKTPWVTPEMYGAVGDGTTNDQAAIQSALNTGYTVYFSGEKNYRVNTEVQIPSNGAIEGNGAIISTAAAINVFRAPNSSFGQNTYINNLNFVGNNAGTVGLALTTYRTRVNNCTARGFTYAGFYVTQTAGAADYEGGVQMINCYAEDNTGTGFMLYTAAEYNNLANCTSRGNGTGLQITGGNNNWIGGKITDNTIGVDLINGSNSGHGLISGAIINHNGTNVRSTSLSNGFLFVGCQFYAGNISMITNPAPGIKFKSCEFGGTPYTMTFTNNTGIIEMSDCTWVTTYTFTITGAGPVIRNNRVAVTKTADYQILVQESDTGWNNIGAAGTVVFTLPRTTVGAEHLFYVDAAQTLRVTAPASTTIRIAGSESAAAGNIASNTVGNFVWLRCISTTQWVAISSQGTWTVT